MPTSSEEIKVIEQNARFEGLRDLLEDDANEEAPTQAEFSNVTDNHPAFKQLYLDLRVAQTNYKSRFVPSIVTEEQFNEAASAYKYNDVWLGAVKEDFKRVNRMVINFLDSRTTDVSNNEEQKFSNAVSSQVNRLVNKIKLESEQATSSLDEAIKRLYSVTSIKT